MYTEVCLGGQKLSPLFLRLWNDDIQLQQVPNGGSGEKSGPTIKGVTVTPPPKLFGARHRNAASWLASSVPRSTPQPVWYTQTRSPGFRSWDRAIFSNCKRKLWGINFHTWRETIEYPWQLNSK